MGKQVTEPKRQKNKSQTTTDIRVKDELKELNK